VNRKGEDTSGKELEICSRENGGERQGQVGREIEEGWGYFKKKLVGTLTCKKPREICRKGLRAGILLRNSRGGVRKDKTGR